MARAAGISGGETDRPGNPLARLPSIDKLLGTDVLAPILERYGRDLVTHELRGIVADIRQQVKLDRDSAVPATSAIAERLESALSAATASPLRAVFNLTGTVLHTNLGRALLPESAIRAMSIVARHPSNLEFDLETGGRGDRDSHVEALLRELTGAEAATVVNNNAAAVLLVLNTLAIGKGVAVSRGELVEIGGSFRIPDVMSRSGCRLIEVGSTNRTHLDDYAGAIDGDTALLMKVHTSNYAIQGFTRSVTESEVADLAHRHDLPMVTDLGSGTLVDLSAFGLPHEPTAAEAIADGADVVTFSGDKLLGGPQAGIIVGKAALLEKIKSNPLKRALRTDKVTMAGLLEVLNLYRSPDRLVENLPVLRLLTRKADAIQEQASIVAESLASALGDEWRVNVTACKSQIGSGSLPLDLLDSFAVSIVPDVPKDRDRALRSLAEDFRRLPRPVIGRIHDGCLLLDLRCLEDTGEFCDQLSALTTRAGM